MGKNKLRKFEQNKTFQHLFQPEFQEVFKKDFHMKGQWKSSFFSNQNSLVLELGCGKGEYTVGLAVHTPGNNYIGVDIKGARLWKGASDVQNKQIENAAFIRTRVEFIASFFGDDEVDEIWITFPDPQLKRQRKKKRLTSSLLLNRYRSFLKDGGRVHLKTDSDALYQYTKALVAYNQLPVVAETEDLYAEENVDVVLSIRTHYERIWLEQGLSIKYISFLLPKGREILELPEEKA